MKCVYKISSVNDDIKEFYIGSTEDFKRRTQKHKDRYNYGCNYKVYKFIRENGGLNTWDIYPIEIIDFPISTDELRQYEQTYLDKYNPELNSQRAVSTPDQRKENDKKYYEKHKEKYKIYNNLKANCPHCNKLMIKNNINRHIKTQHPTLL